jgi:hypothetical protein
MLTVRQTVVGRGRILIALAVVIVVGLGSRVIHSGFLLVDKYLGDALYAVMIYLLLTLVWSSASSLRRAVAVAVIMTVLETFQLTLIPLGMSHSEDIILRIAGRLLGTTFSWLDLAAYFLGIATTLFAEYQMLES